MKSAKIKKVAADILILLMSSTTVFVAGCVMPPLPEKSIVHGEEVVVFDLYAACPGCMPCRVSGNKFDCSCFSALITVKGTSAIYDRPGYNYSRQLSGPSSLSSCWMEPISNNCQAIACKFVPN